MNQMLPPVQGLEKAAQSGPVPVTKNADPAASPVAVCRPDRKFARI
jgi:hypothetical protein